MLFYDEKRNSFEFNKDLLEKLIEGSSSGISPSFKSFSKPLFGDKKYFIFKNFISKDIALKIRDYYVIDNFDSFQKVNSMYRSFYYLNSPFQYPTLIKSLINRLMDFKNYIYQYNDFYQNYCLNFNLNPQDIPSVTKNQLLHSWQSVYLYKNGCKFAKHIDYYGELACFLILSEKGKDYDEGGIEITYHDNSKILLDDDYEYGDLVFLDQSKIFHEVKEIQTINNQIGRIQLYIPTIPPNYIPKKIFFEGSKKPYFTSNTIPFSIRSLEHLKSLFSDNYIHYSRTKTKHKDFKL